MREANGDIVFSLLPDRCRGSARSGRSTPSVPVLEKMSFSFDRIQDEGVVALEEALRDAPQIGLTELKLANVEMANVEMSDVGIGAMASLVHQGRMGRMLNPDLSTASGATDEGMIGLAQAIDARGFPKLQRLYLKQRENVTALGFSAMMHAFVKGCPNAKEIYMEGPDLGQNSTIIKTMVNGMLKAARRKVVLRTSKSCKS